MRVAPKPCSAQFSSSPADAVTVVPSVAQCGGTSHVAACPCRRLRAKSVLISLEAGGSGAGGGKTGARQRRRLLSKAGVRAGLREGMGSAPLCAVSTFSYFHLNEQLHSAESREGKKEATDTL